MRRKKGEPVDQQAQRLKSLDRHIANGESLAYACKKVGIGRAAAEEHLYPEGSCLIDEWWWAPDQSSVEKYARPTVEECVRRNAKRSKARPTTDAWGYMARTPAALSRKYGSPPRITTLT